MPKDSGCVGVLAGDAFLLNGELRGRQLSPGEVSARTGLAKGSIREAVGFIGARVNYSSGTPSDQVSRLAKNVGIPS